MQRYLSFHITGFEDLVKEALYKRYSDVAIVEQSDGVIVYETNAPIGKVNHNPIFSNTFLVITSLENAYGNKFLDHITKLTLSKTLSNVKAGDSFRLVFSHEGQMYPIKPFFQEEIEKLIATQLDLKVKRAGSYWEFWIITRENQQAYFGLRLTYHPSFEKIVAEGELRPDLAGLLCYISDPQKTDVFIDPFCGYGAIPSARTQVGKFSKVYGLDVDSQKIEELKEALKKEEESENVEFVTADITKGLPFKDGGVNRIVTDPPWGEFDKTINIEKLYESMFKECARVLSKDGVIVLLVNMESIAPKMVSQFGFKVVKTYDVLVSGKRASVYKIVKH